MVRGISHLKTRFCREVVVPYTKRRYIIFTNITRYVHEIKAGEKDVTCTVNAKDEASVRNLV